MPDNLDRLIYIDDSGNPASGLVISGWIEFRPDRYADLVARFEDELRATSSLAMLFMDGDGSDTSYRSTHRNLRLSERRVIEDAIHLDSKTSQLTQMADLVAWSANAHVDRVSGNEFAWSWYEDFLSERDPARGPQQI